jgi:hypothetical protein
MQVAYVGLVRAVQGFDSSFDETSSVARCQQSAAVSNGIFVISAGPYARLVVCRNSSRRLPGPLASSRSRCIARPGRPMSPSYSVRTT